MCKTSGGQGHPVDEKNIISLFLIPGSFKVILKEAILFEATKASRKPIC